MENACATRSAAIWAALDAIESGRVKRALVVGVEKMTALPNSQITETLLKCSYVKEEGDTQGGFAGVFGNIASEYFERFGDQKARLVKNLYRTTTYTVKNTPCNISCNKPRVAYCNCLGVPALEVPGPVHFTGSKPSLLLAGRCMLGCWAVRCSGACDVWGGIACVVLGRLCGRRAGRVGWGRALGS